MTDNSREPQQTEARYVPGRVPWGWREVVLASLIAIAPTLALALLSLASGSSSGAKDKASAGAAAFVVAFTLIIDLWYVAWAWRFSLRKFSLRWTWWGFRRPTWDAVWLIPLSLIIVYTVTLVNDYVINPPQQKFVSIFPHTAAGTVLFVTLSCVIAPILEETFFRSFVFQGLAKKLGPVWGAIASAAIFSAVHEQATVFIPLFAMGLLLCWVFYRTGSLWTSIILHATFNTIAMLVWAFGG